MTQKKVGIRQRISYSLKEKLVVVKYAQENGRNAAAKHFNLDAPMVGRWIKQSSSWEEKNKKKKRAGTPGRKAFYPEAEKFLYNWIIEQRKKGFAVNYISMRLQMCKILKEPVIQALYPAGEYEFQGNLSWINSFMKRFDETPVWSDMVGNMTVNNKGDKTVHIRTTGNDKNHFTVVLTCSADGTKYPPICIFKGKQLPQGEVIPKGVICWFQDNGWMTSDLMKNYIDFLFRIQMSENLSKESAMIVYDSFRGHLKKSVKIKFKQHNFHLAVIPAGLTSVCQPLDVSINKPFKDNLRKEWHEWMSRGGSGVTAAGNLKRARISNVYGWVKRSWDAVSDQIIFNSFKKCSISNLLDGSENDMVYEEIDKLIAEYEKENLEEFDDDVEIVSN
ncbi:pogo transposable element with KRAB domain [Rhizophagus clarus]|uniref:Pogo transposable element with KRAB domain n=1 Tax=Rhizophagus clarus TaxID=94130 RepID=A0A8H3QG60_9GLOM|nr:pogo transposable element with KRAB domain [Rhizophagus clarus]